MGDAVKTYCRLCAELKPDDKLVHLQQLTDKLIRLNQPFFALEDLSMPQKACLVCIQSLESCLDFINNLEKAQNALKTVFTKNYVEDKLSDAGETSFVNDDWPPPLEIQIFVKEDKKVSSKRKKASTSKKGTKGKKRKEIKCEPKDSLKIKLRPKAVKDRFASSDSNTHSETDNVKPTPLQDVKSWDLVQWLCSACDAEFSSRPELITHSMEYHKNCSKFKCGGCVKKFLKLETFIYHIRKVHSKALRASCHICNKMFNSTRQRVEHQKSHTPIPFPCTGCNSSFPNKEELEQHIATFYQDGRALRFWEVSEKINFEPICTQCNKKFANRSRYKQHMQIHQPRKPNICERCGKYFSSKSCLLNHILIHEDRKDFKCSLCPSTFRSAAYLKDHMIRHKGEKNHSCSECGKTFFFRAQLKTHLLTHSDSFPFQCEYCQKCFRLNTQLKRHMRQHTGVKPYKCEICDRPFTDWPNYNKHMIRKHNIDTAKTKRTPNGVIRLSHVAPHLPIGNAMADLVEQHVQDIVNSETNDVNVKLESLNAKLDTAHVGTSTT